jgi:hypothetical protein
MILTPLLTGNALRNPELFIEHVVQLGVGIAIALVGLHLLFRATDPARILHQPNGS